MSPKFRRDGLVAIMVDDCLLSGSDTMLAFALATDTNMSLFTTALMT